MKKNLFLAILCVLGLFGTLNAQVVTIDGTVGGYEASTSNQVPVYNNYEYAITQQYYTAAEIGKASGTIESIAFKTTETGTYPFTRTLTIYMVNTSEDNFGIGSKTTKAMADTDVVFEGEVTFAQADAWTTIELTTNFEYTGENVLVCVNDATGSFISDSNGLGGSSYFSTFDCIYELPIDGNPNDLGKAYRVLHKRRSSGAYDATTTNSSCTQTKPVPCVQFTFDAGTTEEYVEPSDPTNFVATALNESKIQLTWEAAAETESYNIYEGTNLVANVTETSYTVKNLTIGQHCFTIKGVNGPKESTGVDACATLVAKELESIIIGSTGEGDSHTAPMALFTQNSWVEQIYTAAEIGKACAIERVSFAIKAANQYSTPFATKEIKIYLAETTRTDYADKAWTAESDLKLVYSDTDIIIGDQEWETFEFDTPFNYSGEKNLAVVVVKSADKTSAQYFWHTNLVSNSVLYAETSAYPTIEGNVTTTRPVVRFAWEPKEPEEPENPTEAYLIKEYFDGFAAGDKIAEKGSAWWTTWSKKPGTAEDGVIAEIDGNKCAHMTYGNDQVLLLGGQQNGVYDLEFDILVPNGKSGYFNILHDFKGGNSIWAMEAFLHMTSDGTSNQEVSAGHGTVHAGGAEVADVACVYDEWMHFRLHIDTDLDKAQYYYTAPGQEEILVYEWQWSMDSFGEAVVGRKLDAMNFCPILTQSEYYLDNFTLKKIGGESAPELEFSAESLEATAKADDMTSVELSLENTGTSIAEYVAWVDYGMGEITTKENYIYYDRDLSESSVMTGLALEEEEELEIAAMYPATSYGNSAAGTYITTLAYPFVRAQEGSIGIAEGSDVVFRIYGQGLFDQPGEVLAEKVVTYEEVIAAIDANQWTFAEFDAPVALTGYNVWATMTFVHAVPSESIPQYPLILDGNVDAIVPNGCLIRIGNSGPFYNVNDVFAAPRGNFHLRMICVGEPVTGGWAELDKTEGTIPVGATETITVDLTSIGLKTGESYDAKLVFLTNITGKETVEIPVTLNIVADDNVEEVLSNAYNIYPNPTSAQVIVEGENINYIAVYNSVGQLVSVVKNSNNIVDMSNYNNGVYYFNIIDNAGQSAVQRVVVAK